MAVTKKLVNELIDCYSQDYINLLGLEQYAIRWMVLDSRSKQFKALKTGCYQHHGLTYIDKRTADIIILYDKQRNTRDAVLTIIHELLHIRMYCLDKLIQKKYNKRYYVLEENIVQSIERLLNYFCRI